MAIIPLYIHRIYYATYMDATCMLHTTDTFLDSSEPRSNSIIITYVR